MFDKLNFSKPSEEWLSGTPVGNGCIGFMQYGAAGHEVFALNHDSLFRHKNTKEIKSAHLIPKIRELIKEGKRAEAEELFRDVIRPLNKDCNPYQPFCDLIFDLDGGECTDYLKELDMGNGILNVSYSCGGVCVRYECFADAVSGLIVIKLECDDPMSCNITLCREEDAECDFSSRFEDTFAYTEGLFDEGIRFCSALRFVSDGKLVGSRLEDFTSLEVYVALAVGEGAAECSRAQLEAIDSYMSLKTAHIADHRALYDRVSFTFDCNQTDSEKVYERTLSGEISPEIYGYLFNMARYCMISSSREGSNPINLQGLWCHDISPMWDCGYTNDINIEMSYWPAEILNLCECERPLFDWIKNSREIMRAQAKSIFGVEDSVYIPQYSDLFMTVTCWENFAPFQTLWSGAAAWIAEHFFTYWKYTCDDAFMRNEGYPFMKACANFYIQLLSKNDDGRYVLIPSTNPENWTLDGGQLVDTCTMDISLIHEIMQNLLYVNEKLGLCDPDSEKWLDIDRNLIDYVIEPDGMLAEFTDGNVAIDLRHRHLSHIYGLFPSTLFNNDEKLKTAAWKAVQKRHERGVSHASSWSMAWTACCGSAVGNGDKAIEFICHIVKSGLMENYLTAHNDWRKGTGYCFGKKVFQIDALFGICRAISNMFISSEEEFTHILPALPSGFPDGKICGVCGWGGFSYDIAWVRGHLSELTIYSNVGGKLCLELREKIKECNYSFEQKDGYCVFDFIAKGDRVDINFSV